MIVRGSEPLAGAEVRVEGREETEQTDDEGRLELDLDESSDDEPVEVSVRYGDEEYNKQVDVDPQSSLMVVNVADRADRETNGEGPVHSTQSGPFQARSLSFEERFDVEGRLGTGGMGVVVKAEDQTLGRTVAIKILSEELAAQEEAREIFMREVRHLATLDHSNLVSVYDVVEEAERPFMITEYVEGLTLEQVLQSQEVLPQSSVLKVAVQLCRAVEYLHGEEIVHRDIKPANIMLKGDGTLKIIDFGLARSFKQLTDKGTRVRGTPAYMAPEQIEGDALSGAIDIYQIGVTLHEIAAGELPFNEGDISYKHVHEQPPYLLDHLPNLLPGLADLVRLCLSKDPDDRPASAIAVREEVERLHQLLTSSRVDRDDISKPNIGGRSDSDLRVGDSDAGTHGDVAPTSPNLSPSDSGVRAASSTTSRSETPAAERTEGDGDGASGGWSGTVGWIAAGILLAAGTGVYFGFPGLTGPNGDDRAGTVAASNEPSEADSAEEREQSASKDEPDAASNENEGDAADPGEPVRTASEGVDEALVASSAAAESAGRAETDSPGTERDPAGRDGRRPGRGRGSREDSADSEGGAPSGAAGGGSSDSSATGAAANRRETDQTAKSESGSAGPDETESERDERAEADQGAGTGVESGEPEGGPEEAPPSDDSGEPESVSGVEPEPEPSGERERLVEPETEPEAPEPSEPVEPAEETEEPSESATAGAQETEEPADESSEESNDDDEESEGTSVPMSF